LRGPCDVDWVVELRLDEVVRDALEDVGLVVVVGTVEVTAAEEDPELWEEVDASTVTKPMVNTTTAPTQTAITGPRFGFFGG
jgi:hypothetical protein